MTFDTVSYASRCVQLCIAADPATVDVDYDPIPDPQVITFPTNDPCVEISINDDREDEPTEYFNVIATVLTGPGVINDPTATVFIRDNDRKCS